MLQIILIYYLILYLTYIRTEASDDAKTKVKTNTETIKQEPTLHFNCNNNFNKKNMQIAVQQ